MDVQSARNRVRLLLLAAVSLAMILDRTNAGNVGGGFGGGGYGGGGFGGGFGGGGYGGGGFGGGGYGGGGGKFIPKLKPCLPVTKIVTKGKLVDHYVPIYKTEIKPIVVPTTFYETNYLTKYNVVTKLIYTTIYDNQIEYDSSVAVGTHYVSVTDIQQVPAVTTVTNIDLQVVPSTVTNIKGVTVSSATILADTIYFTKTITKQPIFTATEKVPFPVVTTEYAVVTDTKIVADTVYITVPLKKPPPVTSIITKTDVHYTPVVVTTTIFSTLYDTVVERQQVPYTVVVSFPCAADSSAVGSGVAAGLGFSDAIAKEAGVAAVGTGVAAAGVGLTTAGAGVLAPNAGSQDLSLVSSHGDSSGDSYSSL